MKTRPVFFKFLSFVFIGMALSFPLQIAYLYNQGLSEWPNIMDKISSLNWISIFLLGVNSYLLYRISPWLKWTLPFTVVMMSYNNYVVASMGRDYSMWQTTGASGLFTVICSLAFLAPYRYLIFNPEKRWWRSSPRKKLMRPIYITFKNGETIKGVTYDVSDSGVFISLDMMELKTLGPQARKLTDLEFQHLFDAGKPLQISAKENDLAMKATVARKSLKKSGNRPAGIGITYKKPWWCYVKGNPILRAV